MLKDYLNMIVIILPAMIITFYASHMLDERHEEIMSLHEKIWELEEQCGIKHTNKISYTVTVTTYNPTRSQTDSTPNITADGTRINPKKASQYRYVALSRDLLQRWGGPFQYGDYIVIEGTDKQDGVYQVRDTMNPRFTNRVDILTTNSRFKYNNITMYKYVDDFIVSSVN